MYDDIDMKSNYDAGFRNGFWIGATATFFGTLILFTLIGLYG